MLVYWLLTLVVSILPCREGRAGIPQRCDGVYMATKRWENEEAGNPTPMEILTIPQIIDLRYNVKRLLNTKISFSVQNAREQVVGVLMSLDAFSLLSSLAELAQEKELYLKAFSTDGDKDSGPDLKSLSYAELSFNHDPERIDENDTCRKTITILDLHRLQWSVEHTLKNEIALNLIDDDSSIIGCLISTDAFSLLSSLAQIAQDPELYSDAFYPERNEMTRKSLSYYDLSFHHK